MGDSMDPAEYYDRHGEEEWERLDRNPVTRAEFENTTEYIERELSEQAHVLDAGGGAGRYAVWLAERGHDVTLLDVSFGQLDVARRKVHEHEVQDRVTIEQGDIRNLPFTAETFDVVCCTGGPLSHILDPGERNDALRELRRVAVAGAPFFVSVMGRLSVVRDHLIRHNPDDMHELWLPLLRTGDYTLDLTEDALGESSWMRCHFFRARELEIELEEAGITVDTLVGLEGLLSNLHEKVSDVNTETEDTLRSLATEYREDPAVVEMSEHILAVGHIDTDPG